MSEGLVPSERRVITILAADIADSTRHIATCDPDDAQLLFDRWFDRFRTAVENAGGALVSYEGDGGIAAFGWPTAFEDHADRACAAAWDIQQNANESLGPDGRPVRYRVGVHSGLAAVRRVEQAGRSHLNTIGAAVNIAAKLQQSAPPGGVLISGQAARLCRRHLNLTPEPASPALVAIQTQAYRLNARPEGLNDGDLARRYGSPLVGRREELARLRDLLSRPRSTAVSAALIGEPGIGKSRLAAALVTEAENLDVRALMFFGDAQKRSTPLAAARGLIEALLGNAGPGARDLDLGAVSGLGDAEREAVRALMAPSTAKARDAGKLTQIQLARGLVNAVRLLIGGRPAILLVEDLHLIDPESRVFLQLLARTSGPHALFLLVTGRPEALGLAREMVHVVLELEPLPVDEMRALARQLWPDGQAPTTMLDRLIRRADGVPFVLEELIRSIDEAEDAPGLPHSVESVIHARLQRVSPGARAAAQALSLLGEDVDITFAAAVLDVEESALLKDLDELERFAFIHPTAHQATHMRHQIIAEACADTIPRERRRQLHRTAMTTIADRYPSLSGRYGQLAFHAEGAGDDPAALEHLWQAGLEARRSSATASLNVIFDRAVAVMDRIGASADERHVDFLLMAFAAMVQLGEFDKVNRHLPKVVDLVRRGGRAERISGVLSQQGMLCWFEGRYAEGLAATEEGIAIARALDAPALIFSNAIMQTNILHDMGQVERAIAEEQQLCDLLTGELEGARLGASGVPRATALAFMGWYVVDVGRHEEGLAFARQAFEVAVTEQDTYAELLARNALGKSLLVLGRDAEAAECLIRARELAERDGYDAILPNLTGRAAHALARLGRADEGIAIVEDCLVRGLHRRTGVMEVFNLRAGYAEALCRGGRMAQGLAVLDEALDLARRIQNPCLLVDGLGVRINLLTQTASSDPRIAADLKERSELCRRYGLSAAGKCPLPDRPQGMTPASPACADSSPAPG